jgi:hypothetical protein
MMMNRRQFIHRAGAASALGAVFPGGVFAVAAEPMKLTPPEIIRERVRKARPLHGGGIPGNLRDRLGLTHYDGHYHLTQKPFLIEGAEAIHRLGMNVAKFWLSEDNLPGYGYNSRLKEVLKGGRLVDVLRHDEYQKALALPFKTVFFEVFPLVGNKQSFFAGTNDFKNEEDQFHEVAAYLLKTYQNRDITFILQHWEGDWMLRRDEGGTWGNVPAAEVDRRCESFIRWLAARQRGVERARNEAKESKCKVLHAAEVNRVWDGMKGIPTLTNRVLPHVSLDLVSWSSYDGMSDEVATWQGIEIIRHHMRPSATSGEKTVYLGEIGKPEKGVPAREIIDWWDRALGVCLAMEIPYIVHWELYCNEPADGTKSDRRPRKAEEMRGFWYLRPDGSLSHGGRYLDTLLKHAGAVLPGPVVQDLRS